MIFATGEQLPSYPEISLKVIKNQEIKVSQINYLNFINSKKKLNIYVLGTRLTAKQMIKALWARAAACSDGAMPELSEEPPQMYSFLELN